MQRLTIAGLMLALAAGAGAAEKVSRAEDRQEVAVAIYNDSLALIKEVRLLDLERGVNDLALRDVSARMRPETASLRGLGAPLRLLEQNFDFDLLTPKKLLEKYVGQTVTVIHSHPTTGAETRETAQVLATNEGTVLRFADRIETGVFGRLSFSSIPPTLRDRPTLVVKLESPLAGRQAAELSYLSTGLSWRADYVAELAGDEARLDLAGWVTLTNQSGTAYENARLQLVAGDVNRVREQIERKAYAMPMAAPAPAPQMAREEVFDYHLYTLGRTTTLLDNQTKQVALLSAARVPVRKEYRLAGETWYYQSQASDLGRKQKIAVFLEFDNAGGELGKPLPKGVVRVYKKDSRGNAIFIGEDAIDHTARNDMVRLKMGNAFDVTATRKQTGYRLLSGRPNPVYETSWRLELANAKEQPVSVKVIEPMPGDWEVLGETLPHAKGEAHAAVWQVPVPAGGKAVLEYSVRIR